MPRPGPRPYECIRRAWHSDSHQPLRGALIQEIFRVVNEIHNSNTRRNREWQEKLPVVVFRAEEILYSKANSESEYADVKTLRSRLDDAVNTMIRREETEEDGIFLAPCIEAALSLGCTPKKIPRGQKAGLTRYLPCSLKRNDVNGDRGGGVGGMYSRSFSAESSGAGRTVDCFLGPAPLHDRKLQFHQQNSSNRALLGPPLEQIPSSPRLSSMPGSVAINSPSLSAARLPVTHHHPHPALVPAQYHHHQNIFFHQTPPQTVSSSSSCPSLPEPGSLVQFLRSTDVGSSSSSSSRPILSFPRCDMPVVPPSSATSLNRNLETTSTLHHNNAICSRMDQLVGVTAVSNTQMPSNISRTLKEVGFTTERVHPSFSNIVSLNSGISGHPHPQQETKFSQNLQMFSGMRDVAQQRAPVVSQIGLSSHLPSPSYSGSDATPRPSSNTATLCAARPSSNSTTALSVVDSVRSRLQPIKKAVHDLQLRLGPPGGGPEASSMVPQPSCTMMLTTMSHMAEPVAPPACVDPPLNGTTPDPVTSSKRMRFSLKNFDAPVSMPQHTSSPYPSFLSFAHLRG